MRGINDGSVDNIIIDDMKSMGDPGSFTSLQIDPYFIERIDVLKGPSSVLYGRSNPGGLAALTTKRPEFEQAARIDVSYGSHDYKQTAFDVTGPLSDNVAYRLVGLAKDADVQVDHVEETRYALMPSLMLNLSDDTLLNLYAYLQHDPNGGYHGGLPASGTLHKRSRAHLRQLLRGRSERRGVHPHPADARLRAGAPLQRYLERAAELPLPGRQQRQQPGLGQRLRERHQQRAGPRLQRRRGEAARLDRRQHAAGRIRHRRGATRSSPIWTTSTRRTRCATTATTPASARSTCSTRSMTTTTWPIWPPPATPYAGRSRPACTCRT